MKSQNKKVVFHIWARQESGTAFCNRKRKEGKMPCNIYGLGEKSISALAEAQGIKKLWETEGDTGLVYLQVDEDKKQVPVLIEEVKFSPMGNKILHVSFKRVNLKTKIEAEVSVTVIGEAKIDNAVVSLVNDTVLVEALPADLPDNFELDISELTEVGQNITLADLKFDKDKVTLILEDDEKPEEMVLVSVQGVKEEKEEEPQEVEVEGTEKVGGTEEKETVEKSEEEKEEDKKG